MADVPRLRASRVPAGRIERFLRFGMLAGTLATTAAVAGARRWWSGDGAALGDVLVSVLDPRRLTGRLARLRGAAMKLGQLLAMHGGAVVPPELADALATLGTAGDAMTRAQLHRVLGREYGRDWRRRFQQLEEIPVAAASIGQVHRAVAADGRTVALKIQLPGVARSIGSDVENLGALLRLTRVVPGDVRPLLREVKRQLTRETDYAAEARSMVRYGASIAASEPAVRVPRVHPDLSTGRILAMDFVEGVPLRALCGTGWPQAVRDRVALLCQRLVLRELFEIRLMQTDPNVSNYAWDPVARQLVLLDFGSMVEVAPWMAAGYRALLEAALAADRQRLRAVVLDLGWLRPGDTPAQQEGFVDVVLLATEPLRAKGRYHYGATDLAARIHQASMELALDRRLLRLPPPALLFVQRKLSGTWLLCATLRARVDTAGLAARVLA